MVDFANLIGDVFQNTEGKKSEFLIGSSAVLESVSSIRAGMAKNKEAQFKASIMRRDARNRKAVAPLLRREGRQRAADIQKETAQLIGQQRATMAANGIVVDQGTAVDLVTETAGMGAVDAINAIANAEREAAQLVSQANFDLKKAEGLEASGRNILQGSIGQAGMSLVDGARQIQKVRRQFSTDTSDVPIPTRKPQR